MSIKDNIEKDILNIYKMENIVYRVVIFVMVILFSVAMIFNVYISIQLSKKVQGILAWQNAEIQRFGERTIDNFKRLNALEGK